MFVVISFIYFFSFFYLFFFFFFFFSSRRRHTRLVSDWSSDVCSSDLSCAGSTAGGRSPPCSSATARSSTVGHPHSFAAHLLEEAVPDLSRAPKISVLCCAALRRYQGPRPTSWLCHNGVFHQSSRRLSAYQYRRTTLHRPQSSPCYVVQDRLTY